MAKKNADVVCFESIIGAAGEVAKKRGVEFGEVVRAANELYSSDWGESPLRALHRYTTDMKVTDPEGWDWHLWDADQLRRYIQGIRTQHPDAYGKYCQWIGCEADRMHENHFCISHEMVARANE